MTAHGDELYRLRQRIERLPDSDGGFRSRLLNCLQAAGCPQHALVLARADAERLVKLVLAAMTIKAPAALEGCLKELEKPDVMSRGLVPAEVITLLHTIRVLGNKAAHDAMKIEARADDVHLVAQALVRVAEWY